MKPLLLFLVSSAAVLSGCSLLGMDRCEAPLDARDARVMLKLLDATGTQDLFSPPARYAKDSVVVRDEQGLRVPLRVGKEQSEPAVTFFLLDATKEPQLGQVEHRQFIVYLSKADQDTIQADYVLFENDCDRLQYRTLHLYYNGAMVHENNTSIPELLIRKR